MSQNHQDSILFRPLPRLHAPKTPKAAAPRLRAVDGVWLGVVSLLAFAHYALANGIEAFFNLRMIAAVFCPAMLYLLGYRVRDRMTGLIAGLFLATDLGFPKMAHGDMPSSVLAFLTVAALYTAITKAWVPALVLGAVAGLVRPDGVILAGLLLALYLAQPRKTGPVGAIPFLVITVVGWAVLLASGNHPAAATGFGGHRGLLTWLIAPSTLILLWFLVPFGADIAESARRPRWMPVALWTILFFLCESLVHFGKAENTWLPIVPIFYLLAAGGLARLIPMLAGDLPQPALRYVIATMAVLTCIAFRTMLTWPSYIEAWGLRTIPSPAFRANQPSAPMIPPTAPATQPPAEEKPAAAPPSQPAAPAPATHPAAPTIAPASHPAPPTPHANMSTGAPVPVKPAPASPPKPAAPQPAHPAPSKPAPATGVKPAANIPQFVWRHGRWERRSKWAILWDQQHAARPAPHR